MPVTPNPEQLAQALDDAGTLHIARIGHIQGRQVVMRVVWQGQEVEFQATITDVFAGEVPDHPRHRRETAHMHLPPGERLYEKGFTEAEVRHLGYPLYMAEEWLRKQKQRLGTFAAISREYGYPETTMQGAARQFGWELDKPRRTDAKAAVQAEWRAGNHNKKALAKAHSVSIGSVFTWVKELESEAVPAASAPQDDEFQQWIASHPDNPF